MAAFQSNSHTKLSPPSAVQPDEFIVRIPRDNKKKFTMMKFGAGAPIDFSKLGDQTVKIERENNLKEYKSANDLDMHPKFGAGSEYGRDQKEESRRKKYGIMLKKYNPNDQPWHLKIGSGKQIKKYKGLKEGTISENTSYYIFTKAADGAFEAFPVEEWYNFSQIIKYKYLDSEEAEEEYSRRDKTLNLFSIMVKKRMKKEEDTGDDADLKPGAKERKKSQKKKKDLILTDIDEWEDMDDDDDDDDDDDEGNDDEEGKAKKKTKGNNVKKTVKNSKKNSDDEAVEESDEGDYDDREVDYMSNSGSSSSMSDLEEADEKDKKYEEKGVDEEAGLRNILDSEAEDDDEEDQEKEDNEDEPEEKNEKKEEKKKDEDDSTSSSSGDDDSDIEKDGKLNSALFLPQKDKKEKKEKKERSDEQPVENVSKSESGSSLADKSKERGVKRKAEKTPEGKNPPPRKHKTEDSEGITEEAIRRYLMRKPMTTKDLLTKFKSKKLNMTNDKITHVIAQLLKKINPEKMTINKKLYLSLKKPE